MFDHKAVNISFKPPPRIIRTPPISRSILSDPDIDLVVKLSIYETYLHHTAELDPVARQQLLESVGRSKQDLVDIFLFKKHTCGKIHGNEIVVFNVVYMRIFSIYAAVYSLA
jgi:hypothetical protein